MNFAPGSLLAQVTTTAGPSLAYSATYQTEITRIIVANIEAGNDKYSIYHADSGAFSAGNALHLSNVISGATTITPMIANEPGTGISVKAGGKIGVASSGTAALVYSIYGVTRSGR